MGVKIVIDESLADAKRCDNGPNKGSDTLPRCSAGTGTVLGSFLFDIHNIVLSLDGVECTKSEGLK